MRRNLRTLFLILLPVLCAVAWVTSIFRSDSVSVNTSGRLYTLFSSGQRVGLTIEDPWPGRPLIWHDVSFERLPAGRPWWVFFDSRPARTGQAPWAAPTALCALISAVIWLIKS